MGSQAASGSGSSSLVKYDSAGKFSCTQAGISWKRASLSDAAAASSSGDGVAASSAAVSSAGAAGAGQAQRRPPTTGQASPQATT
ncbi:MAG: hypothetical protein R2873_10430 [Caldilineaceae bacterium]